MGTSLTEIVLNVKNVIFNKCGKAFEDIYEEDHNRVRTVACRGNVNCINKRTAGQLAIILKPQCGRRVCVTRAT